MKITRDGKTYELTRSELCLAYEEEKRNIWRGYFSDTIEDNTDNLRFGDLMTMTEFAQELMEKMEEEHGCDAWEDECDEVFQDLADEYECWYEEEDDAEDEFEGEDDAP